MDREKLQAEMRSTMKSSETDDWVDRHVVRPFSFLWAKMFARLHVTPNAVTVMSMVIGAASCLFFAHGSWHYEGARGLVFNLVGILLLLWADVFDCTDGQLARLTGQSSRVGRILDGLAGFTWYIPIYAAFVYRIYCHHDIEFSLLGIADSPTASMVIALVALALSLLSGFYGIAGQQRIADYYIQAHLFFQKGAKGSELDNSRQQQALYDQMPADEPWLFRAFQKNYVSYTRAQERSTPQFQRLMKALADRYGSIDQVPADVRERFLAASRPLQPVNALLTFNFRTLYLVVFTLVDMPIMVYLFELIVMEVIRMCVNRRHERFCRQMADEL